MSSNAAVKAAANARGLVHLADAARILGVNRTIVTRYVRDRKLEATAIGGGVFVRRTDLDRLAAEVETALAKLAPTPTEEGTPANV